MDNQTDYEKARSEAWAKFYNKELKGRPQWEPISRQQVFDHAFVEAYRYGRVVGMEEAKKTQIEGDSHIKTSILQIDDIPDGFSPSRARIAAMAMQGLLTAITPGRFSLRITPATIAEAAVEYADALLAELEKVKE